MILLPRKAVEPDHERGIRVTYMDAEGASCAGKAIKTTSAKLSF